MFEYIGIFGFILGIFGLTYGVFQTRKFTKIFNHYEPLIKRAYSLMGTIGKDTQVDANLLEETEGALKEGVFSMLTQKYPEIGIVMAYLEENHPDIFDKISENPEMIVTLYQKYAPVIKSIMGQRKSKEAEYNV